MVHKPVTILIALFGIPFRQSCASRTWNQPYRHTALLVEPSAKEIRPVNTANGLLLFNPILNLSLSQLGTQPQIVGCRSVWHPVNRGISCAPMSLSKHMHDVQHVEIGQGR